MRGKVVYAWGMIVSVAGFDACVSQRILSFLLMNDVVYIFLIVKISVTALHAMPFVMSYYHNYVFYLFCFYRACNLNVIYLHYACMYL